MSNVLLITVVLVLVSTIAFAQPGSIGIFADDAATNCNLPDVQGFDFYYIIHVDMMNSTGVMYRAAPPACFTGQWFIDQNLFAAVGDSQTGVSVDYGACLSGNRVLQIMGFINAGTTSNCCYWTVGPHPSAPSGKIEATDCLDQTVYPTGGQGIVNALPSCDCNVPVEDTTWGKVKALYAE